MAVRYPITSGNWSNTLIWNGGNLPTSADDVYANGFTVTIDVDVTVLSLRNTAQSPAVAGGGFILNDGVTVTCTNAGDGIYNTNCVTCITYSGSGESTINANIRGRDGCSVHCIHKTGTGTLNINGYLAGAFSSGQGGGALLVTNTGIINIVGNITAPSNGGETIRLNSACTLNIVGNITTGAFNGQATVRINSSNCILNITGILFVTSGGSTGWSVSAIFSGQVGTQITLVGDIDATSGNSNLKVGLSLSGANYTVQHTGNIIGTTDNVSGGTCVSISSVGYYNHVGYVKASLNSAGFVSTNASAINILTGPFISSPSGIQPIYVARMHYQRTMGSYYEFRDNSTNGALPPAGAAPATRLVSPDTIVDAPIPANVRQGVVYASGSQVGTLAVPSPNSVSYGVPTDNTVGTAVLTPQDVWNYAISNLNTDGSIGKRLKNAATVESTGDQLSSLL